MTNTSPNAPGKEKATVSMAFLFMSFILIGVVNTFLGPILPFFYEKWQIDDARAGYLLSAQGLGALLGTLSTSFLYKRIQSKWILAAGYIFIFGSMVGLNSKIWEIGIFSAGVSGLALGFVIPTTTLIISQSAGEKRSAAINLLNFFWALGALSSPLFLFTLSSPDQLAYVLGILALSSCILLAVLLTVRTANASSHKKTAGADKKDKIRLLLSVWVLAVTVFLQIGIEASLSGWLATFTKRATISEWWLLVPTLYWSGFLLSRLLSPFYLKILGEKKVIRSGLGLLTVGQILLLFSERFDFYPFIAFLLGFGTAPVFPTAIAVLSGKFEKKAPEMISYMFFLAGLSAMLFPSLIGYVASLTGDLRTALGIPVSCSLILLLLHLVFLRDENYQAESR